MVTVPVGALPSVGEFRGGDTGFDGSADRTMPKRQGTAKNMTAATAFNRRQDRRAQIILFPRAQKLLVSLTLSGCHDKDAISRHRTACENGSRAASELVAPTPDKANFDFIRQMSARG